MGHQIFVDASHRGIVFLGWYQAGIRGETPVTPAPGFTWGWKSLGRTESTDFCTTSAAITHGSNSDFDGFPCPSRHFNPNPQRRGTLHPRSLCMVGQSYARSLDPVPIPTITTDGLPNSSASGNRVMLASVALRVTLSTLNRIRNFSCETRKD